MNSSRFPGENDTKHDIIRTTFRQKISAILYKQLIRDKNYFLKSGPIYIVFGINLISGAHGIHRYHYRRHQSRNSELEIFLSKYSVLSFAVTFFSGTRSTQIDRKARCIAQNLFPG